MGKSGCLSTKNANDFEIDNKKYKKNGPKPLIACKDGEDHAPISQSNVSSNSRSNDENNKSFMNSEYSR